MAGCYLCVLRAEVSVNPRRSQVAPSYRAGGTDLLVVIGGQLSGAGSREA